MRSLSTTLFLAIATLTSAVCFGQGTLQITFDGPPLQPPGSDFLVQQYFESGMYFRSPPGSDGFARTWTGLPPEWPNNGTPYLSAGAGDSLAFSFANESSFGVASVDLAGFSTGAPDYTVDFVGYRSDGGTISTSFSGTGVDFQTYYFGSDWSSGLTRVEIPNYGWSLDNLVVAVPEPSANALLIIGFIISRFRRKKLAGGTPALQASNRDVGENFYVGAQL
jgi:hypothetical protein